ncbi:MAG: hypothetical protein FWD68_19190 [Alphaproteobacteria bacterium]|nr:hypothetical protein [Alphaproteobacteria bacterium]
MTDLLDHAIETARQLPPAIQDEIARILLQLTGEDQPVVDLDPEEETAVLRSREAARRGEFATDAQLRDVWKKHGL